MRHFSIFPHFFHFIARESFLDYLGRGGVIHLDPQAETPSGSVFTVNDSEKKS